MTRCMLRLARSVVETRHVANMAFKRIGRGGQRVAFTPARHTRFCLRFHLLIRLTYVKTSLCDRWLGGSVALVTTDLDGRAVGRGFELHRRWWPRFLPALGTRHVALSAHGGALWELYGEGKIGGFLHLYIGEEAVATGVMPNLRAEDALVATYREHGHALLRGVSINAIMAAMCGKREGWIKLKSASLR